MADFKKGMAAVAEVLFPGTGELPFRLEQLTMDEAAELLDAVATSTGKRFDAPEEPLVVIIDRGHRKEPIVCMHGYAFLRMLKRSEFDA